MNRKIKIIDKESPFNGKVGEGHLVYYDILHGGRINGGIQDLYLVTIDGQELYFKTYQIDVNYYHQQEDDEYREKFGYGVGDKVRILEMGEVGCKDRNFNEYGIHVIKSISYCCGIVYFEKSITSVRWPKLEVIKRAKPFTGLTR